VRAHIGTAEVIGRVQILGTEEIAPGDEGFIQFRAEESFACARGDRYVLRSYSPMTTIGGGLVLDSAPRRHRRMDPAVMAALAAKQRGTPDDLLDTWLQALPFGGAKHDAGRDLGMSEADLRSAVQTLVE